ncbi:hypothetical protein GCM10010371_03010 [Streptomyces subrutilus]|uniref:Uncharacterized protein n=1 Tax=Streptomyces subrutilus TaxID=36818 RepID=A0A5P2UHZ2_9ACTN|nr:hypothetical protein [Streptomyces subrutilus]QEU77401.1 hypothetical protein CP968_03055 [Streptomyces subrutilus]GGZ47150.1 hypothetical protein GCM10010371_03010 [Streptomyces subrutilus]
MPDAATSASRAPDVVLLDALSSALAEAADTVGEAARYASGLALGARLPVTALARGGRCRLAWRTLLRTLTDPAGLGWAPRGRGAAGAGRLAGLLARRESLAVSVAVCGLRARIGAAQAGVHGGPADPGAAAVLTAAGEGRPAEAARLFRALVRDRGAGRAFVLLAPSFADILAWDALTDTNPFNDHAGWQVATCRAAPAEPILGLGAAFLALCDRDRGPAPGGAADRPASQSAAARSRGAGRPQRPAPRPADSGARIRRARGPEQVSAGLRGHAGALRAHARRLHAAVVPAAAVWPGPRAEVLRAEVTALAGRCDTAANGFALAAAQLDAARTER